MANKTKWRIAVLGILFLSLILPACGAGPTPTQPVEETGADQATPTQEEAAPESEDEGLPTLRMALLPVLDVLPFFIAQDSAYFQQEGVAVELVPVSSALEREQLLAAGEVDGMLTDVIGPAITNAAQPSVRIVAMARRAYENAPLFRILAAPGSAVESPSDLAGVPIGISENSVIQYLGDRLLTGAGLSPDDIVYESVPSIPTRFSLMMEGQLGAAILPDPLAQAAIEAGAIPVLDDTSLTEEQYSQSVLSFSNTALEQKPEAVRAFLRAWFRAVQDLNSDPSRFRELWLENTNVPESVQDTYEIPPFPVNEITSEVVWLDVVTWLLEREIIAQAPEYETSVDSSFLPSQ
ncbi:MAG: MetQ/NlpA family ABC transporter substrate-binding protein [Anaerolineae bacterium]